MRIIAGKYKNRILSAPKGLETRPTSSKLREALFNILQQSIEGASFLDLFAGSGAIGFEALSRGASQVVFVDSSRTALQSIEKNLSQLGIEKEARLLKGDALLLLQKMEKQKARFDIIYADPPYAPLEKSKASHLCFGEKVLVAVDEGKLLKEAGHLFIEEGKHVLLDEVEVRTLRLIKMRQFGHSNLFHFIKEGSENAKEP